MHSIVFTLALVAIVSFLVICALMMIFADTEDVAFGAINDSEEARSNALQKAAEIIQR